MLVKPPACEGCPLETKGQGFVPPVGPFRAPILFLGEAPGEQEVREGLPFVGPAGGMFLRLLNRNHWERQSYRIHNCVSCRPPNNWLEGAPWQRDAIAHCAVHRDPVLDEPHKVIVPLGAVALKAVLERAGHQTKGLKLNDYHGTVTQLPSGQLLVPTYHPSHLQRGAHNLFGVVSFDLQLAHRVAKTGWTRDAVSVVVDPPVDWFTSWIEQVEAAVGQDAQGVWLAVDIETPDKAGGRDEGDLGGEDVSYQITRVNFSVHPDEGVSVPYAAEYIPLVERLLRLPCPKALWNKEYDEPRLVKAGHSTGGDWYDFMWAWHHVQSDLPRGLGFVAPMYCEWGPWKHLSDTNPGYYAACDGFKTYRVATGIARDLVDLGMWDVFARHTHALHTLALHPAQQMGIQVDRERLVLFIADLEVKQRRLLHEMQGLVPDAIRPLTPKQGYTHQPKEGAVHAKATAVTKTGTPKVDPPDPIKQELYAQVARLVHKRVPAVVLVCTGCGAEEVGRKHRCRDHALEPALSLVEREVDRWYWQEPFNPDSPTQILAYLKFRGHAPGKAKKTGNDSTDRDTLQKLAQTTGDPLYGTLLKSRAVGKVKGTYGQGTLKRMDAEGRIHPVPTFKPSTHRLSYQNPNITNVVTDRGGADNLASGFRACIVATTVDPEWEVPGWAERWRG